jgi:hypothetical protein
MAGARVRARNRLSRQERASAQGLSSFFSTSSRPTTRPGESWRRVSFWPELAQERVSPRRGLFELARSNANGTGCGRVVEELHLLAHE